MQTEKQISCKQCDCQEYFYRKCSKHIGAYCAECESWIKWIAKGDIDEQKPIAEEQSHVSATPGKTPGQLDFFDLPLDRSAAI